MTTSEQNEINTEALKRPGQIVRYLHMDLQVLYRAGSTQHDQWSHNYTNQKVQKLSQPDKINKTTPSYEAHHSRAC
jgi:hypothetical protein